MADGVEQRDRHQRRGEAPGELWDWLQLEHPQEHHEGGTGSCQGTEEERRRGVRAVRNTCGVVGEVRLVTFPCPTGSSWAEKQSC